MKWVPRALLVLAAFAAAAQPVPPANLAATMQDISHALGVSCGYCHSAERGSGQPEPKKEIARAMMAMTRDINARIEAAVGKTAAETARVDCVTCHRGVAVPRQLSDVLMQTLREKGAAAAVAQYRDLYDRYSGRGAYDFGEDTLLGIAQTLANSRPDDAIALLQLNLEFHPKSAQSYVVLAYAYTRKIDDASAMAALEKALTIEPDNGVARGQLEQLKSYHRKR
ncbi:MAG: photosynthetic reaction center cytochrome c subunit [Acidobacteriia bacterium]|nr:photosynthetic reaction center cytochrome c subunit [Terriglobia bacterium]